MAVHRQTQAVPGTLHLPLWDWRRLPPVAALRARRAGRDGRTSLRRGGWVEGGISLFSPVLLLVVWEVLTRAGVLNWRFFPAPTAIAGTFASLMVSGELAHDVAVTMGRVGVGFVLGAAPGLALGLVMGLSRVVRMALNPIAKTIYPIPKIAIFPLILLIFGLGELSKYVAIASGVVFFVLFNTLSGVMEIDDIHLDVAKNCGASRWNLYRTVALPGAIPSILIGVQQGIVAALLIVITTEFVGGTDGVGSLIWVAWQKFEVERMYSGLIVMSLLGFLLQQVLELVAARLVPWKPGLYGIQQRNTEETSHES